MKSGLPLLLERVGEHPGRLLDGAPDFILATTPKQKERLGVNSARQGRKRGERRRSWLKIPSEESPSNTAWRTVSEADGSKQSLSSNSTSAQLLAVASSGPRGKEVLSRMNFL